MPDTAIPKLSSQDLERISDALLGGFKRIEGLEVPLHFKWGLILGRYINLKQGTYYIISDLLDWTEERGKTRELVKLAYSLRPGNPLISAAAESLGISLDEATEKYGSEETYTVARPPPKPALQAMVVANSRFVDFGTFLSRFQSLGDRICRVETPRTRGTGFLVGPNLVLTNFHVVESALAPAEAQQIICRFDYHAVKDPAARPVESKVCRLADAWLVASRPYSLSDTGGGGEAGPDELDYALLRLAEDFAGKPAPRGGERGWFKLDGKRPLLAIRDFAVVPQHAQGRELEVAWGAVVEFNGSANRVRYDTRTDAGSSGSPCFTLELELFGLHHATDPVTLPRFNQAIPLDLIAKDLKQKGLL